MHSNLKSCICFVLQLLIRQAAAQAPCRAGATVVADSSSALQPAAVAGERAAAAGGPVDAVFVDRQAPLHGVPELQPLLRRACAAGVLVHPIEALTSALLEGRAPVPLETLRAATNPAPPGQSGGGAAEPARSASASFGARRRSGRLSDAGTDPDGGAAGPGPYPAGRQAASPLQGAPAASAAAAGGLGRRRQGARRPDGPTEGGLGCPAGGRSQQLRHSPEAIQWLGEPVAAPTGAVAAPHRRYYGGFVRVRCAGLAAHVMYPFCVGRVACADEVMRACDRVAGR